MAAFTRAANMNSDNALLGKRNVWSVIKCTVTNYRTWVLFLTLGYSCGVELIVNDVIASFFQGRLATNMVAAGGLGVVFNLMNLLFRASGGMLSDMAAIRFGMRGRLWTLWIIQSLSGAFCMVLAVVDNSLGATIATMFIFSMLSQQAYGAHSRIVPFISHRAQRLVSGIVVLGGSIFFIVSISIFFAGSQHSPVMSRRDGLFWMGVMTLGMTTLVSLYHFPQWGSMFFPSNPNITEEDYYLKEWTAEEVAAGLHKESMCFAAESRSERGSKADGSLSPVDSSTAGSMTDIESGGDQQGCVCERIDTTSDGSSEPTDITPATLSSDP